MCLETGGGGLFGSSSAWGGEQMRGASLGGLRSRRQLCNILFNKINTQVFQ